MKNIVRIVVCGLVLLSGAACLKVKEYPLVPEIKVLSLSLNQDSTAQLMFNFTDGDGDIGLAPADTQPPYNVQGEYYNNLLVKYFEKRNGVWFQTAQFGYRVEPLTPQGRIKVLEGEMDVKLFYNVNSSYDTIKYSVQLIDRALNKSNVSESEELVKF